MPTNYENVKEKVSVEKLIERFADMAKRGTLLNGPTVSREDLLAQITGTIVVVAMEE